MKKAKKSRPARVGTTIRLSRNELALIVEALDSHAYWQLSSPEEQHDGYTYSSSREVQRCGRLEARLRRTLDNAPAHRRGLRKRERGSRQTKHDDVEINPETGERYGGDIDAAWDELKDRFVRD